MNRMFGSRNVIKVAKYAVVIYIYTADAKHQYHSDSTQAKARRTTKKMLQKLYERLKGSKYDWEPRNTGFMFSELLAHTLENSKDYKYFGVWMLSVNQLVHDIVHRYAQDYDPNDLDSKKCDFFTEIYNELTDTKLGEKHAVT